MKTLAELAVEIARANLGKTEATGHNDGAFVEMLQAWMDGGAGWMKGQPWCATFASWCIDQAAKRLGSSVQLPKAASTSELFAWYEDAGLLLPAPLPNCIGMIRGDGGVPGKTHHHTFFVEGVDGDFLRGIDGNWKNAVSESRHAVAECDFGPII